MAQRILGLDPGLRRTGWGVIEVDGNRLRHIANGTLKADENAMLSERLRQIHAGVTDVVQTWRPDEAAVEETFVNKNPNSTLKLGQARGVVLLAPAQSGLAVHEYAPNQIKKAIVGAGHADKEQIHAMVRRLLPGATIDGADAADALATAICHAHHASTEKRRLGATVMAGARA